MQFRVPQYIDVEDKIFGPFTFKQFIYLAGGAGLCYLAYRFLPIIIAILVMLPVGLFALGLTFYKINSQPLANVLENWFGFFFQSKLYIWKKAPQKEKKVDALPKKNEEKKYLSRLSGSKLKDLAWGLDVLDLSKKN
ncbi:hypothetical protein A3I25_02335 [Candidatus Nomurabacteria bacterium RIFCSPLOWO2_02_FULL_42_17]|uniref:PrgI family protein n=2 Tax=Candidatus Nomuraibacteriota TaxID=1752729 RepID=A0A1F6WJ60_9BACT|nr:MAG: hypothetical protein UV08_C0015G0004 [Parcubacteria group bacterium GW2011_GWA2_42_18]OGI81755.1 MAG: hypothetical protein A3B93_00545 [Candidatus Nomurabacteria bacterium RIFCSPHIGHO2_02_FULL_42_24]OGI97278.1 MAG: hypothetical protein A3I25_02335 [Candidatus Nomurabacteria bacterium RIFCSPLOWO2_02_FULL_42_17]OGN21352.1 MAG: hypothetical protein A2915_04830 [Candidatus Yanofskybacteria bacterium RIFCSPLOWO2_01_FULL_41_34]